MRQLLTASQIEARVSELGAQLGRELPEGPLTIVGVLTGSIVFLADLVRVMKRPLQIGLVQASSYRGAVTSPGELILSEETLPEIAGRHVLVIDDIFDTGQTLKRMLDVLSKQQPASLHSAVLLRKSERRQVVIDPDYCCFDIPDVFVVGYGLDYAGEYRHLPFIAAMDDSDLIG